MLRRLKVGGQGTILRIFCYAETSHSFPQTQTQTQVHTAPPTPKAKKEVEQASSFFAKISFINHFFSTISFLIHQDTSSFDIVKATQYGAFDRVQEIIESGFDVNERDEVDKTDCSVHPFIFAH